MRLLLLLGVMYAFAAACLLLSRRLRPNSSAAKVNQFVGVSVGSFATGLVFLVIYAVAFPSQNQAAHNEALLRELAARIDTLALQVDSLRRE